MGVDIISELLLFITGILFFKLLFPILNTICEVINTSLEVLKAKSALKITKINSKIQDISENENCPKSKRAIGFYNEEEAPEEDDVDED